MREIKFRAWNKESQRLTKPATLEQLLDEQAAAAHQLGSAGRPWEPGYEHLELMQYTGLKDRNGVEIFEGDIVVAPDYQDGDRFEVKYLVPAFVFHHPEGKYPDYSYWVEAIRAGVQVEVIGNVYDNPELLEAP